MADNRLSARIRAVALPAARSPAVFLITLFAAMVTINMPNAASGAETKRVSLSGMAGKWRGSGWGMRNISAPRESVRCRMTAKYRPKARKLSVSGKCAAAGRTFTLLGHVAETRKSNKLTGRWVNPDGFGSINISGVRRGNRLVFEYAVKEKKSKISKKYRTIWVLKAGGFNLASQVFEKQFKDIGNIRFSR